MSESIANYIVNAWWLIFLVAIVLMNLSKYAGKRVESFIDNYIGVPLILLMLLMSPFVLMCCGYLWGTKH